MAKTIAIVNHKGGVGKTTTAVNLAACLAAHEKKTLIIDMDPQGNVRLSLGLNRENFAQKNIYHVLLGKVSLCESIYASGLSFLDICPSDEHLLGAELELSAKMGREAMLFKGTQEIKDKYDYIILDSPPSLGLLTINALYAADSYLVPTQAEFFSMDGFVEIISTVNLLSTVYNKNPKLEGILLTMLEPRLLHKQVTAELKNQFGEKVFNSFVPKNVKIPESQSHGKPIIYYDIASKGAEAFLSLTREILGHDIIL